MSSLSVDALAQVVTGILDQSHWDPCSLLPSWSLSSAVLGGTWLPSSVA